MSTIHRATRKAGLPMMNLLRFQGLPILEQLQLEEKLLRTSSNNWCIINDGTDTPTIVMGISGSKVPIFLNFGYDPAHQFGFYWRAAELIEVGDVMGDNVPVIRRFTGGGTVIVDDGTVFVTLICNMDALPQVQPYPRSIMSWSGEFYDPLFGRTSGFLLRENDYVFGDRKFGGNAQSITKNRWIRHTSFLWDYEIRNMAYMKQPSWAPKCRSARDHTEFVCRLKEYMSRHDFIGGTSKALEKYFSVRPASTEETETQKSDFVHSTRMLTQQELKNTGEETNAMS